MRSSKGSCSASSNRVATGSYPDSRTASGRSSPPWRLSFLPKGRRISTPRTNLLPSISLRNRYSMPIRLKLSWDPTGRGWWVNGLSSSWVLYSHWVFRSWWKSSSSTRSVSHPSSSNPTTNDSTTSSTAPQDPNPCSQKARRWESAERKPPTTSCSPPASTPSAG